MSYELRSARYLAREVLGVTEDTPGVAADWRGGGASGSMGSSDSRGTLRGSGVERGTGGSSQGVGAASGDGAVRSDRPIVIRKTASRPKALSEFRDKVAPRRVESFRFNHGLFLRFSSLHIITDKENDSSSLSFFLLMPGLR